MLRRLQFAWCDASRVKHHKRTSELQNITTKTFELVKHHKRTPLWTLSSTSPRFVRRFQTIKHHKQFFEFTKHHNFFSNSSSITKLNILNIRVESNRLNLNPCWKNQHYHPTFRLRCRERVHDCSERARSHSWLLSTTSSYRSGSFASLFSRHSTRFKGYVTTRMSHHSQGFESKPFLVCRFQEYGTM